MSVGEDVKKLEITGDNVKWYKAGIENCMAVLQKIKHSKSTFRYVLKRIEHRYLNRYLYTSVHSSDTRGSQKVETNQTSTEG